MFSRDSHLWNILGALGIVLGLVVAYVQPNPADYGLTEIIVRWMGLGSLVLTALLKFANSPAPGATDGQTIDLKKIAPAILLCLLLPGLALGCAPSFKGKLAQVDRSVQSALYMLDQVENEAAKAGQVPADFHKSFSRQMVTALTAGQTFHRSVMAYQPGQAIPLDVIQLAGALQSAADLVRSLPPSDTKAKIAAVLDMAASVAAELMVLVLPQKDAAILLPIPVFAH